MRIKHSLIYNSVRDKQVYNSEGCQAAHFLVGKKFVLTEISVKIDAMPT